MPKEIGDSTDKHSKTCVVLGGRGFIGRALVERLLKLGNWIVRVADSHKSPELKPTEPLLTDAIASGRAAYFQVDVRDKSQIVEALRGVSVVFFTDSMDLFPQDFYLCYKVIVQGAKNVVKACRECGVKRLIHSSSADVVFDDVHDICGGDESLPYSGQFWDMVADLRTQAEALILSANGADDLLTCALRPCNVFGPGDPQLMPLLVNMAKSNWDKFIIGSGNNVSDFTYVDNVAHAHICAEESLSARIDTVSGKAFFITNLEPMKFREFAFLFLDRLGHPRPFFNIPPLVAEHIFSLIKLLHRKSDFKKLDPSISIYKLASCTRTFSCLAAQKHINYSPVVSLKEAMTLTVDSFSDLAIEPVFMRYRCSDEPSKIEKLLGGGQVADILLWRDERKTFICFALLGFMYYWFFLSGNTFVSSLAQLLLLTIILLCGHHVLQLSGYGSTVLRLPPSCFEISEVNVRSFFFAMKCMWDKVECLIKSLAQGEDWLIFFKVASFMYVFKWIVSQYLVHAIGLALVFVFSVCFVYEQYEEKIDEIAVIIYMIASKLTILLASKLPKPNSSYNPLTEKGSNRSLLDDRQ
ncbi:3beta-hydroxysteroid-dehydrogenase/decarboxylase-like [Salvia splendens]|uniref:3beta-hydroxysteroid- dehydrogenase/decarboxylase-like n=1 Tax=Salvia splendens TaxID=180675 RepID=UPI001C258D03|nr:3beta-hydroxysteroid-dehydrogenase/decarboxylase-like [Salvia splendens]